MFFRIKGTQDFLDLSLFNFIIETTETQLHLHHFVQIATPILEPTKLFVRSLGQETDVVSKEMYLATSTQSATSKDTNDSICLRPEATAATARAFVENNIQSVPWKVFSWGPMFRHERPQKGRYRQFHQINIEIIGTPVIAQDALFIAMLDSLFLRQFSLDNYGLHLNFLGCLPDRTDFKKTLYLFLQTVEGSICSTCQIRKESNILRIFDCKNESCKKIYQTAPKLIDNLCTECNTEWTLLQEQLEMLSISFTVVPTLVRGLDYYNKTVFEFVSGELGAQNAFCGGGRYDQLIGQISGKQDQPSIGAALGIERLLIMLEPIKEKLHLPQENALHVVIPLSYEQQTLGILLAAELTYHGLCADIILEKDAAVHSMMKKANKMGARYCIIVGSQELEKKEVTIKNMVTGQEQKVKQTDMVATLKN